MRVDHGRELWISGAGGAGDENKPRCSSQMRLMTAGS